MRLKQITIAASLSLTASQALALSPTTAVDFTINSAGSSTLQSNLGRVFSTLCQVGTLDVFYDTGTSGSNHSAYSCTLQTTLGDPLINGKKVLFLHRAQGGSINGVNPVARGDLIARMVVDATCVATGYVYPTTPQYKCPNTVNAIPDAGQSEVEPALFQGINLPLGVSALTNAQLANLSSFGVFATVYGIATTNNVNAVQPNLSRAQVTSLLTGSYPAWDFINPSLGTKPPIICRRVPGSGGQAAVSAYFNRFPCVGSASVSPLDHTANPPGVVVNVPVSGSGAFLIESSGSGAVANCLNAAYNGGTVTDAYGTVFNLPTGSAALGVFALDRVPSIFDQWKFSNLDTQPATPLNATTRAYDFFVEHSFQYRNKDICVGGADTPHATPCHADETLVAKPIAIQTAFMTKFILTWGVPNDFAPALPTLYDPKSYPAGQVMTCTRNNNTCQPCI